MSIDFSTVCEEATRVARTEPFVYFEVPDLLPDAKWHELARTFPPLDDFEDHGERPGAKKYVDDSYPSFGRVVGALPAWEELIGELRSASFLASFRKLARPYLRQRPLWERMRWRLASETAPQRGGGPRRRRLAGLLRHPGTTPVRVGAEFSYLDHGDCIPPHTDAPGKLLSLMLYFPSEGQEGLPLGTEFYGGKPGCSTLSQWETNPTDETAEAFFDTHEVILRAPYRANVLVGFLKSDVSWHGLSQIPAGVGARRALVVNVFRSFT